MIVIQNSTRYHSTTVVFVYSCACECMYAMISIFIVFKSRLSQEPLYPCNYVNYEAHGGLENNQILDM